MSKTQINADISGAVTLTSTNWDGSPYSRRFVCRDNGGYVYEVLPNGDRRQVCSRLACAGSTLTSPSLDDLLSVIRREWRRKLASDKKYGY